MWTFKLSVESHHKVAFSVLGELYGNQRAPVLV